MENGEEQNNVPVHQNGHEAAGNDLGVYQVVGNSLRAWNHVVDIYMEQEFLTIQGEIMSLYYCLHRYRGIAVIYNHMLQHIDELKAMICSLLAWNIRSSRVVRMTRSHSFDSGRNLYN